MYLRFFNVKNLDDIEKVRTFAPSIIIIINLKNLFVMKQIIDELEYFEQLVEDERRKKTHCDECILRPTCLSPYRFECSGNKFKDAKTCSSQFRVIASYTALIRKNLLDLCEC